MGVGGGTPGARVELRIPQACPSSRTPSVDSRPCPALPYTLLLPITPLLHPSSGLLPGLPASSLCPQAIPHMAQRCHPIACHSWLPGLPRTKSQPLSLAFEVPRGLCSLPWNFICSLIPASPTLPFCQTSGYLPLNPGAIIQYLAQDT